MGYNKEDYELKISINNYEKSDIIISLILGTLDLAFIILYSLYLEAKNEAVNHLKKKLGLYFNNMPNTESPILGCLL